MSVKLSKTNKLDGIKSWSLQALDTCPGSKDKRGGLVPACQGCYATTGNYVFDNVKAPRLHNREDWQRDAWTQDMVEALAKEKFFRWFDSGDMYDLRLARKILDVMRATPSTRHWLPTRMAKFPKYGTVIKAMQRLPNVMVRFSSDSIRGEFSPMHGSTIVSHKHEAIDVHVCEAYEHAGKCSGCRVCWDKSVPVVAYVAHGVKMQKVIRLAVSNA